MRPILVVTLVLAVGLLGSSLALSDLAEAKPYCTAGEPPCERGELVCYTGPYGQKVPCVPDPCDDQACF